MRNWDVTGGLVLHVVWNRQGKVESGDVEGDSCLVAPLVAGGLSKVIPTPLSESSCV
jgi:hypothetical protein